MRKITYVEAVREAIAEEMRNDERVFVMGEDIVFAYAFSVTKGLVDEFGSERIRDTPISENAIVGLGVGAALTGMRPVAEIQFGDLMFLAMDQIVNQAAKIRYMSGGQARVPLVIRAPGGFWGSFAAQHSQSIESIFMHTPGLKVAVPSTPYDAKGLLKTAIRGDDPVLFFEHKRLYQMQGEVPDGDITIPFGKADLKHEGGDVTIVATHLMVHRSLEATMELAEKGIEADVIDPRTLVPLDKKAILSSVEKTGRLVIVEEGCRTGGIGAEIAAIIGEEGLALLDAPIRRVGVPDTPIPFSPPLESYVIPDVNRIVGAVTGIVHKSKVLS